MSQTDLRRFAWLSIGAAIATIALKGLAWWLTGSVGLLSDALESLVNLAGALMTLATDLARGDGMAVLFTEHDMDVVFTHAHRILVLHQGELVADGTPDAVRADARVRQIYLGTDDA